MGSSSETFRNAKIVPLMDQSKIGEIKKKLLLETGKMLPVSGNAMVSHRGNAIAELKSLYNDAYLQAMGYSPSGGMKLEKIDTGKILQYTKSNLNSNASNILDYRLDTLTDREHAILYLQNKPNYDSSDVSFKHTDNKSYLYYSTTTNGNNVDIGCVLNVDDTVSEYLNTNYPDGYEILDHSAILQEHEFTLGWFIDFKYKYFETITTPNPEPNKPDIVETIEKWSEPVTHFSPAKFLDFTIPSTEHSEINIIANNLSGPFTITGSVYIPGDINQEESSTDVQVTGSVTVTYLSNNEFNVSITAPNPYPSSEWRYRNHYNAWENGKAKKSTEVWRALNTAVAEITRKLIWRYNTTTHPDQNILYYLTSSQLSSFITKTTSEVFPIIPLKRHRSFVKNTTQMDLMLKKIGLERDDFTESLKVKDIYDAYLMFGILLEPKNNSAIEYIFEYFALVGDIKAKYDKYGQNRGEQHVNIYFDGLGMYQSYNVTTEIKVENINKPLHSYWYEKETYQVIDGYREGYDLDTGKTIQIPVFKTMHRDWYCHKESNDYYVKINPSVTSFEYLIGGRLWKGERSDWGGTSIIPNSMELRIPIVREVTSKMNFNYYCDILEQSMCIAYYTKVTVKTKWYQSGIFQIILIIVITVVNVVTGGAASPLYLAVMGMVSITMVALGDTLGKWGIVVQVIMAVVQIATGNYAGIGNTFMDGVILATSILKVVVGINDFYWNQKIEKNTKRTQKKSDELQSQTDAVYRELDELKGDAVEGGLNLFFSKAPEVDDYYELALGNLDEYDIMYGYGMDLDRFTKLE